jgi:hypothetical protein
VYGRSERQEGILRTIRWNVTLRAHNEDEKWEEMALVVWQDYSVVVNWNVAFQTIGVIIDAYSGGENVASGCLEGAQRRLRGETTDGTT